MEGAYSTVAKAGTGNNDPVTWNLIEPFEVSPVDRQ